MVKVLFVCLGNICRSPMAEGLFQKLIDDHQLNHKIHVSSRATSMYEVDNPPHYGTQNILKRMGIDFSHMFSKQIKEEDFQTFDYIIGMDHQNLAYLKRHAGKHQHKVFLLRDIDPNTKGEIIPDPYYDGSHETTFVLLKESLKLWFDKVYLEV